MTRWILVFVLCAVPAQAALEWFPPRFAGERIFLVPKPHYNSRDEFGLSVEAIRPFRTGMQAVGTDDSEFHLLGRIHTTGNGSAEASTLIHFGDGRWYLKAKLEYMALVQRFWGIGPNTSSSDEELYRPQDVRTYVELFRHVVDGFRVGARVEWNDFRYVEVEDGGLLDTQAYPGLCCDNATGLGIVWELDRRDDVYGPRRGYYAQGFWMSFSDDLNGDYAFQNVHVDLRSYHDLGRDNVLALQAFTFGLYGNAPIWRYAAIGGRPHSRGYRRGRYLDRRFAAVQAEWRRPIVGRLDGGFFGGVAAVAPTFGQMALEQLRPTFGAGLRLHVTDDRDLMLRADLAFGTSSIEGYLKFGHAF